MKPRRSTTQLVRQCGVLLVLLLSSSRPASAQLSKEEKQSGKVIETVSLENYERAKELLFQTGIGEFADRREYLLVIRTTPSFSRPTQIGVIGHSDGRLEITYSSTVDPRPLSEQLDEVFRQTGNEEPVELAKRITLRQRRIKKVPPKLRTLIQALSRLRLSPYLDTRVTLDGSRYDLWFDAISNKVHFSLAGPERRNPLIRWISQIQTAVEREVQRQE